MTAMRAKGISGILAWVALTAAAMTPAPAETGFLEVKDGTIRMDGRPFTVRANDCDPAVGHWFLFKGPWFETGVGLSKRYGFNAIRTWVPGTGDRESAATYGRYVQDRDGFFREFDEVFVQRCRAEGLYLILTLTDLPQSAGGATRYDADSDAYRTWSGFARDFCGRYRDEPTILFWEVANEYRGSPDDLPRTRRFYEAAAKDIRAVDPNHPISSGVDGMLWAGIRNSYRVWMNINTTPGVDLASSHQYTNDRWSYNWHTERDYVRMVREEVKAAKEAGRPLFLGEFGVARRISPGTENPELIWYLKAVIGEGIRAYGFHWFYPWKPSWPASEPFSLNPADSPRTAEWIKELNGFAAAGTQVPESFGPRTTDYALPLCDGAAPYAGPYPRTTGRVKVEQDGRVFGKAAPSLRIAWEGAGRVSLGPHHPNDLSEYAQAGGYLGFSIRCGPPEPAGVLVVAGDAKGLSSSAELGRYLGDAKKGDGWREVRIPLAAFVVDWSEWAEFGLKFPPGTAGSMNIDDVEVACGKPGSAGTPEAKRLDEGEVRAVWLNPWAFNSPETRAATLAKLRRARLNTVFLQTPAVAGNYGITWGDPSPANYSAFLKDLKAAGVAVHGWIINRERAGEGTQADFANRREQEAQRDWALAVLETYPELDGVHFDYIRWGDWKPHDAAKAAGITETVRITAEAIRRKHPGRFLTAAVFVAASANYMGETRDGKRSWTDSPPEWLVKWLDGHPGNWYAERGRTDPKLKPEWILGPSFLKYQQDPVAWLEPRGIDAVCPMQYTGDEATWKAEVELWKSFRQGSLEGIVMGLGWLKEKEHPDWELKPDHLVRFVKAGRAQGLKGFSIFSLGVPGVDDEPLVKALSEPGPANDGEPPFRVPAPTWLLAWK